MKFGIFLAIGFLSSCLKGYSDDDFASRIRRLESDVKQIRTQTVMGNFGAKTAVAFPQIDGYGFFVTGDFLWWKLYGFQTDSVVNAHGGSTLFKGPLRSMNFEWEPGFRLAIGYIFDYEGWDLSLSFTNFQTKADQRTKAKDGGWAYPLWGLTLPATKVDSFWHFHLKALDLVLGRDYFVSKSFSLRPFFGLNATWLHQQRHAHIFSRPYLIQLKGENRCWGLGPELGVDTHFFFGRNFSLYTHTTAFLFWGNFHVKEREFSKDFSAVYYDEHLNTQRMIPSAQLGIGLCYETNFSHNCNHFMVKLGYEGIYWWRPNQWPLINNVQTFSQIRTSSDLGVQGLIVNARIDF